MSDMTVYELFQLADVMSYIGREFRNTCYLN